MRRPGDCLAGGMTHDRRKSDVATRRPPVRRRRPLPPAIPTPPGAWEIVFDGGSLGNPGKGYGSFDVRVDGQSIRLQREDFGDDITNNQAEYRTLIEAMRWLAGHLGDRASNAHVVVRGDSQLVLNQLNGLWKVKNEGLRTLHEQASMARDAFAGTTLVWQPRARSVERLGH